MLPQRHYAQVLRKFVRYKHKMDHWSVQRKKIFPIHKALAHFDDFYKQVFDKQWPSIRQGLLGKPKYVAIVNNFGDAEETKSELESLGALNMRRLFELEKSYVGEELAVNRRIEALEKIWQMERDSEEDAKAPAKEQGEAPKLSDLSLESSLSKAQYDLSRIVDSRQALSAETLHHFMPATKIKGKEDYVTESSHYSYYGSGDDSFQVKVEKDYDFHFPPYLNVYCYERSNHADFEGPTKASTQVLNYYLMDGGSLLPVLALDLKPGMKFLDLCSAPGGKSLLAIQTLYPDRVVCNDVSMSRANRIHKVMRQYLFDFDERWSKPEKVKITCVDGRAVADDNYDRILVDVPCTNDRLSLKENDNNIFKGDRIKERLQLPELQCALLVHALRLVKKGGIVVYSTCSLSPVQNDGVVNMALKKLWEETNAEIVVRNMAPALVQTQGVFKLAEPSLTRFGHLVLPYLPQNYGPTYFCKLQKIK